MAASALPTMQLDGPRGQPLASPLAWAVLGVLALAAVYFEAFPYDVLAYHGPFSAVALGLPRLKEYGMSVFIEQRFQGFPPLWRWMLAPGLALELPRLLGLPNLLALGALVWAARTTLRLPWAVSVATVLLFPIVLANFRTAYQDFFVGALTTAAMLLLSASLGAWATSGQGAKPAWQALPLVLVVCLTKYQGLFQGGLALGLALLAAAGVAWRHRPPASVLLAGPLPVLLLSLLLCGLHPLHNLLTHHNPFFPIAAGPFPGPELQNSQVYPAYTTPLGPWRGFLNHWLSASELDWIARGVVPNYTFDQARSQTQYGGLIDPRAFTGLVRTGGSFGPAYLTAVIGYGVALRQALRQWRRKGAVSTQGWALVTAAPFLLLAAAFPVSHELRYYLPLLLLPAVTAVGWWWQQGWRTGINGILLALLSVAFLLNFTQPLHSTAKGLRQGAGLAYALRYPTRDLPSRKACLGEAARLPAPSGTIRLPRGMAFACRLQLPGTIRVLEEGADARPSRR